MFADYRLVLTEVLKCCPLVSADSSCCIFYSFGEWDNLKKLSINNLKIINKLKTTKTKHNRKRKKLCLSLSLFTINLLKKQREN